VASVRQFLMGEFDVARAPTLLPGAICAPGGVYEQPPTAKPAAMRSDFWLRGSMAFDPLRCDRYDMRDMSAAPSISQRAASNASTSDID
jgi:hypothetical protein